MNSYIYKLSILFISIITIFILVNILLTAQDKVRYTAVPNSGYEFVRWEDNVTTNPRILTISQYIGNTTIPVMAPTTSRISGLYGVVFHKFQGIIIQDILDATTGSIIDTLRTPIEVPRIEAFFKKKAFNSNIIDIDDTTKQVKVDDITFDIKYVEGGTYYMGYNDPGKDYHPSHSVTLSNFWMGETEITQALWVKVMGNNPSNYNGGGYGTNLERPVESVSFYALLVFCNKLSIKLGLEPVYTINGSTDPSTWYNYGDYPLGNTTA